MTSVNSAGYNAITQNGNPYRKTSANKKAGVAVGALGTAALIGYNAKYLTNLLRTNDPGLTFSCVLKSYLKGNPLGFVGMFGKAMLGGLIIGAIVDGIVNKVRRNRADKAASTHGINQQA